MKHSSKASSQVYKRFKFRRRHDQFLKFRLKDATHEEIIEIAKELGFNLNDQDIPKETKKRRKSFLELIFSNKND